MVQLNFYERTILRELIKQSENGILNRSYQQMADEINGITFHSIRNYILRFVSYGIMSIENKGTHRQSFKFNMEKIKKLLVNE